MTDKELEVFSECICKMQEEIGDQDELWSLLTIITIKTHLIVGAQKEELKEYLMYLVDENCEDLKNERNKH